MGEINKMIQKKKIRVSSWIFALVYLIYGVFLFVIIPRFNSIFHEMNLSLPPLAAQVFSVPAFAWILSSSIIAILLITRDISGKKELFPDWLALSVLLISVIYLIMAVFLPTLFPMYTLKNI
jgi:hypothetical protein